MYAGSYQNAGSVHGYIEYNKDKLSIGPQIAIFGIYLYIYIPLARLYIYKDIQSARLYIYIKFELHIYIPLARLYIYRDI